MGKNILEINNIDLEGEKILFNLKVPQNIVHSILFKSQADKNQLLKLLDGQLDFKEGDLLFNDKLLSQKKLQKLGRESLYVINQYSAVNPEKDPLGIFKFNKKGDNDKKSTVFPDMTVAENIFFGREPLKKFLFFKSIDQKKMLEQTNELLNLLPVKIYPEQKMCELSPLKKQLVELLKAVSLGAELIIIDQALVDLNKEAKEIFLNFMQQLKEKNITILYFTTEIEEVFAASDLVSILKDGKIKATKKVSELEHNELALLLLGR